jgi:hypothetical protein
MRPPELRPGNLTLVKYGFWPGLSVHGAAGQRTFVLTPLIGQRLLSATASKW